MKNSGLFCILSLILIHASAFFIVHNAKPELNDLFLIKEISYSCAILLLGTTIMYLKFKKDQFVPRFLIITVFQMLAILSFVVALVYLKITPIRLHGLSFILTYLAGMVVQTGFFLRFSQKTSK
jgi:hypothetical protein